MKLSELEDFLADAVFVSQEQSINTSANTTTIGNSLIFQANKTNSSNLLKYPEKTAIQTMTANEKNTMITLIILIIVCLIFFVTLLNMIKVRALTRSRFREPKIIFLDFNYVLFFFNYIMADKVTKINAFLSIYTYVTVSEYVKKLGIFPTLC